MHIIMKIVDIYLWILLILVIIDVIILFYEMIKGKAERVDNRK